VGEFVDQHHVRMSSQHRIDIEFVEVCPAVPDSPRRDGFQSGEHCLGVGSGMRLNEGRDHVDTLVRKALGFGQHRKGLARSWCYPEVDMQPAASRRRCRRT
jgi:hypothetical protein